MYSNKKKVLTSLFAGGLMVLASIAAFGASGDKVKVKGMIISRTGETLIVNSPDGKVTVVLDDDTKVQDKRGALGIRKTQYAAVVLIPGLKVQVDGVSDDQNRIVARTITFDGDDLETAQMIEAGLHPTSQQVAANAKDIEENTNRFTQLGEYDTKGEATVNFDVGSSKISAKDQTELKQLAQTATSLTGYIVQVKGFADSTGNAAMNQQLSEDRAQAVIAYLVQECSVPVRHVVAPGAMGTSYPTASNETAAGRAANRRVEVKVLVNRGIAGK
jgi:outer membrane protein OmpA-like peptidoglycan-associated protein